MILLNYVSFHPSFLLFPLWCFHISSFTSKHDQGTTVTSFSWYLFVIKKATVLVYASNPLRLSENLPVILLIQTRQCGQSESVVGGTEWWRHRDAASQPKQRIFEWFNFVSWTQKNTDKCRISAPVINLTIKRLTLAAANATHFLLYPLFFKLLVSELHSMLK